MKSNQFILTVLFVLGISFGMHAQSLKVSPKIGVNLSGLEKELMDFDTDARFGYNVGLDFRIGEGFFQLHPGAHYYSFTANVLTKEDIETGRPSFEGKTTIQQLKVPLNIGLNLTGDGGLIGIYAKGGLTPSLLLGVTEKEDVALSKDDINTLVLGGNFGAGVDLFNFLTIEANYEIGLSDFFKDQGGRNNVFTLSAGLVF